MAQVEAKVLFFLPEFMRRLIVQKITRAFLRDVNDFLFRPERRALMERSVTDRIMVGGGPFVVIAHSQGSMIAYNVLRQLGKAQCDVSLFITIGSPLGLQEVQDVLRQWTGGRLPFPPCVTRWVNVAERLDPVAFDTDISNDFEGKIVNHEGIGLNPDSPRHPHSATGYLRTAPVKDSVREVVGTSFPQAVTSFEVAKDLISRRHGGFA